MEKQQPFIRLVDRMLSLHQEFNNIKDQNHKAKIKAEIKKIDHEIDEWVYKLYGITEEEKKRIQESLR